MDIFVPLQEGKNPDFKGSTLILPVVSLANVPQLASDLLVHSSTPSKEAAATKKETQLFQRVGSLRLARDCFPCVGGLDGVEDDDGQDGNGITTAIEVYHSSRTPTSPGITIVHPRSPPLNSRRQSFTSQLVRWAKSSGFSSVLILGSLDASERSDEIIRAALESNSRLANFVYLPSSSIPNPSTEDTKKPLTSSLSSRFPFFSSRTPPEPQPFQDIANLSLTGSSSKPLPWLPSGGLTRFLLAALGKELDHQEVDVDVVALLMYVAEGDNRDDARAMAGVVADTVGLSDGSGGGIGWREPRSWKKGLYGNDIGDTGHLFG